MSAQNKPVADDLVLGPFNIDEDAWFYTEKAGMNVVIQSRDKVGNYIGTAMRVIPWSDVRNALAIKDHRKRRKP